jgi:hypothetical protein
MTIRFHFREKGANARSFEDVEVEQDGTFKIPELDAGQSHTYAELIETEDKPVSS